jgi:hypothetical protein
MNSKSLIKPLTIKGCNFRIVTIGTCDYLVRVQKYQRLAQEPFPSFVTKSLIEVFKCSQTKRSELVGALARVDDLSDQKAKLKNLPVFVPLDSSRYRKSRIVYHGDTGLELANKLLTKFSLLELTEGINHYLVRVFSDKIFIMLKVYSSFGSFVGWNTIKEIDTNLDTFADGRPPLFYTWKGIVFEFYLVMTNDGVGDIVVYYELNANIVPRLVAGVSVPEKSNNFSDCRPFKGN